MSTAWGGQPPNLSVGTHWGAPGIGILGSAMKANWESGEHGPSPLANDSLADASEYRWYIVTTPPGATVDATELGRAVITVSADGVYVWSYQLVEDGALLAGPTTIVTNIGASSTAAVSAAIVGQITGTASASVNAKIVAQVTAAIAGIITGNASASAAAGFQVSVSVGISGAITGAVSASASASASQALSQSTVGTTATLTLWAAKDPREEFWISFTFPGDASDVLMNVDTYSQFGAKDVDPESIFGGPHVVQGSVVTRRVKGGVDLVDYYIDCVATVVGDRMVAASMLPVRTK